jgi:hypothetical protein
MSSLYTKRAAAAGLAGALALGTIASVGALSPAAAAEGTTYMCTLSNGDVPLQVTGSLTSADPVEYGQSLSGLVTKMGVTLPAPVVTGIGALVPGVSSIGGKTQSFQMPIEGGGAFAVDELSIAQTPVQLGQPLTMLGSGKTSGGKATSSGTHDVSMPTEFTFLPFVVAPLTGGVPAPLPDGIPCKATTTPASAGTVTVTKATSKVVTKVTNAPVTPAKRAKVRVTVRSTATNTGKVLIKKGKTVLAKGTLTSGKKVLTLTKLGKGSHKLVAIYKGDANTKASKKAFTLKVQR